MRFTLGFVTGFTAGVVATAATGYFLIANADVVYAVIKTVDETLEEREHEHPTRESEPTTKSEHIESTATEEPQP